MLKKKRIAKRRPSLTERVEAHRVKLIVEAEKRVELARCPQTFVDEETVRNFTRPRKWLTIYRCKACGYWHTKRVDGGGNRVE